jgi:hypothetical protein
MEPGRLQMFYIFRMKNIIVNLTHKLLLTNIKYLKFLTLTKLFFFKGISTNLHNDYFIFKEVSARKLFQNFPFIIAPNDIHVICHGSRQILIPITEFL